MYERLRAEPRTVVQRSPIHNLGLFCTRDIDKHDMVIEYVGELVRPVVGDIRDDIAVEKGKSTYMFRLDEGTMPVNSKFCVCDEGIMSLNSTFCVSV